MWEIVRFSLIYGRCITKALEKKMYITKFKDSQNIKSNDVEKKENNNRINHWEKCFKSHSTTAISIVSILFIRGYSHFNFIRLRGSLESHGKSLGCVDWIVETESFSSHMLITFSAHTHSRLTTQDYTNE